MYISPRLREGNRFAGGSLETFSAILVRLQAERKEGWNIVLASFISSIPHFILPGCTGEPVGRRVSRDVCGDFGSPPSGTGG